MSEWQPIETAPMDRPILVWHNPAGDSPTCRACKCSTDETARPRRLCLFHAHAEGMGYAEEGLQIAEWGGAFDDSTYEYPGAHLPDWWFQRGSDFEVALNPTHWMPLPEPPA